MMQVKSSLCNLFKWCRLKTRSYNHPNDTGWKLDPNYETFLPFVWSYGGRIIYWKIFGINLAFYIVWSYSGRIIYWKVFGINLSTMFTNGHIITFCTLVIVTIPGFWLNIENLIPLECTCNRVTRRRLKRQRMVHLFYWIWVLIFINDVRYYHLYTPPIINPQLLLWIASRNLPFLVNAGHLLIKWFLES